MRLQSWHGCALVVATFCGLLSLTLPYTVGAEELEVSEGDEEQCASGSASGCESDTATAAESDAFADSELDSDHIESNLEFDRSKQARYKQFLEEHKDQAQDASLPPVLMGTYQVSSPAELRAEMIAAELALETRAVVDGPVLVYDSPSVSISVRKVSNEAMARNVTEVKAPDGAGVTIPQGVQGKSGGPITITITSYHASEKIMKGMPEDLRVRFEKERGSLNPLASDDNQTEENQTSSANDSAAGQSQASSNKTGSNKTDGDRVDFFTTKTSVSWRGNLNVKYAGLAATVPAHDRTPGKGPDGASFGGEEEVLFAEEKAEVYKEVEDLASLPESERLRAFRQLARKWHPDKNPDDAERAAEVFNYLQQLKEDVLGDGSGYRVFTQQR